MFRYSIVLGCCKTPNLGAGGAGRSPRAQSMKRLLQVAGLAAGVLVALCGCGRGNAARVQASRPAELGVSEPLIVLTYANFPPASTFPCVQMERWAREITARTEGVVKVQTFPNGVLLGARDMFDGVVNGTADIGCVALSYYPGRFPVSAAVDLPHGFPDARTASLVLADLIDKYQPEEFSEVKVLTVFTSPPAGVMTDRAAGGLEGIKGLSVRVADSDWWRDGPAGTGLSGLVLRVPDTGAEVARRLGAMPVPLTHYEVPAAIKRGVLDGVVSSLDVLQDLGYAALFPYAERLRLNVVTFAVVMNRNRYESLPCEVRLAMDDLYREHAAWTGEYVDRREAEALQWAVQNHGLTLSNPSKADLTVMSKLLEPMLTGYAATLTAAGLPGQKILNDIEALKLKHAPSLAAVPASVPQAKAVAGSL